MDLFYHSGSSFWLNHQVISAVLYFLLAALRLRGDSPPLSFLHCQPSPTKQSQFPSYLSRIEVTSCTRTISELAVTIFIVSCIVFEGSFGVNSDWVHLDQAFLILKIISTFFKYYARLFVMCFVVCLVDRSLSWKLL